MITKNNDTLEQQLETFRVKYPSDKVMVYDTFLVYKCAWGWADVSVRLSNSYIRELGLNLVAKKETENSYTIQRKEN